MTANRLSRLRAMRGFSLVELMVSLTIGLILMVAVLSAYIGSASAGKAAEAQGRLNEDAQAALSVMAQQIRMAGNNPVQQDYAPATPRNPVFTTGTTYVIRGCDGTFSTVSTAGIDNLTCTGTASTTDYCATCDVVAVKYEADRYNTVKDAANLPTDCLGNTLAAEPPAVINRYDPGTGAIAAANANYYVADNRFFIKKSADGVPSLYCLGSGSVTAQPLVENIEDLQVTYGVERAEGTKEVGGYVTAADVPTLVTAGLNPLQRSWNMVMTVRICVVARSETSLASDAGSAQYYPCSGNTLVSPPAGDLRLRRAFTTTVVLRNRVAVS